MLLPAGGGGLPDRETLLSKGDTPEKPSTTADLSCFVDNLWRETGDRPKVARPAGKVANPVGLGTVEILDAAGEMAVQGAMLGPGTGNPPGAV